MTPPVSTVIARPSDVTRFEIVDAEDDLIPVLAQITFCRPAAMDATARNKDPHFSSPIDEQFGWLLPGTLMYCQRQRPSTIVLYNLIVVSL